MAGLAGELPPGAGGCLSAWREAMCEAGGRGNAYDTRSQERLLRTAGEALEEPLSVDECLERAGGWGAYQRSLMLTLGTSTAACAVHMLQPIFLAPLLDWPLTPVQRGLVSSAFFAGYAVGVFGWAWLSDRRGRRRGRQYAHLSFPPRHVRDRSTTRPRPVCGQARHPALLPRRQPRRRRLLLRPLLRTLPRPTAALRRRRRRRKERRAPRNTGNTEVELLNSTW